MLSSIRTRRNPYRVGNRTAGDCSICTATYGSGIMIGSGYMFRAQASQSSIRLDPRQEMAVYRAAGRFSSTTLPPTRGRPTATAYCRRSESSPTVSAWPGNTPLPLRDGSDKHRRVGLCPGISARHSTAPRAGCWPRSRLFLGMNAVGAVRGADGGLGKLSRPMRRRRRSPKSAWLPSNRGVTSILHDDIP